MEQNLSEGKSFLARGLGEEAERCFSQVASQWGTDGALLGNLAVARQISGRLSSALSVYRRCLDRNGQSPVVLNDLGLLFWKMNRAVDAERCFRQSLHLETLKPEPYANLGELLAGSGRLDEAAMVFREGIDRAPQHPRLLNNLALLRERTGRSDQAHELYKKALDLLPHPAIVSNYLKNLLYLHDKSPDFVSSEHRRLMARYDCHRVPKMKQMTLPAPDRRIRIGYVSGDFRRHSVASFLDNLLHSHDRTKFEIFAYSTVNRIDEVTTRLRRLCDHWHDISAMNTGQAVHRIVKDRIDILCDLSGHTAGSRLDIFAFKPAMMQVSLLGYPHSTGLSAIDFRIGSEFSDPEDNDRLGPEKVLRLPHFLTFRPPENVAIARTFGREFTFGAYLSLAKLNTPTIDAWAEILKESGSSKLALKADGFASSEARENMLKMFAARGVPAHRILIRKFEASQKSHLECYNDVDLSLDSFPYNGTTTVCESLYMGVPVVSLCGKTHASRIAGSIVREVDPAAATPENWSDYISCALDGAANGPRSAEQRMNLRAQFMSSRICRIGDVSKFYERALTTSFCLKSAGNCY